MERRARPGQGQVLRAAGLADLSPASAYAVGSDPGVAYHWDGTAWADHLIDYTREDFTQSTRVLFSPAVAAVTATLVLFLDDLVTLFT
jgi:hypothetical protein